MPTGLMAATKRLLSLLRHRSDRLEQTAVESLVGRIISEKESIIRAIGNRRTPLYLLDRERLLQQAKLFKSAFARVHDKTRVYYAVKSNNHPTVAALVVEAGLGLDVSSGEELSMALEVGCNDIVFSGPGKTNEELAAAAANASRVTVLIDSFHELRRLDHFASQINKGVRAGVRITTDDRSIWQKFGIPLADLKKFMIEAERCKYVELHGIQFHLSWNMSAAPYERFIGKLCAELRTMSKSQRRSLRFIDIGDGFWPESGEWLQSAATDRGRLETLLFGDRGVSRGHYHVESDRIEQFMLGIGSALKRELPSDISCTVCAEPGRWISDQSMHLALTVVDRKKEQLAITDGGNNAIGWDRYESDYCPIINISRPDLSERECLICGSLCTPHDIWGYSYFGSDLRPGDLLLIPNQGAYTYSLRQNFIKAIPEVVEMGSVGESPIVDSFDRTENKKVERLTNF